MNPKKPINPAKGKFARAVKRAVTAAFVFGVCLSCASRPALAAKRAPYTYTVAFYAGNRGAFQSAAGLTVEGGKGKIDVTAEKITVSGLSAGDVVSFNTQAGAFSLMDSGKYYVRGLRESGRDNGTVAASAFRVDGDADYVAAYGIKGDTVAYTVNYEDANGNALAESNTYYGNIGDKPVVAYAYIPDYTPDVLAQTKTLSANAAENVFTFIYTPNAELGASEEEPPAGTEPGAPGSAPSVNGPAEAPAQTAPALSATPTAPAAPTPAATPDATPAAPEDAEAPVVPEDDAAPDDVALPDEDVPLENPDLRDLDDEENEKTPTGNIKLPDEEDVEKGLPLALYIGMGTAAGVGLAAMALILKKRRKTAKGRTGNADGTDKPGH